MILEIKNYTKIIKNKTILDGINLKLTSGNVYGFYGRNGSGKTMLFRAISTLIFPSEGDVLIDDKSIIYDDYDLSNIGIVLEDPGFYSHLNAFDNLSILYQINHKKNPEYIESMIQKVGLEQHSKKKYKEYSLGMKQKLRIAQAIMENQQLIILDEPTSGLDEKSIDNIRNIILSLKEEDKMVLLASHNKDDLKLLCDKIYNIEDGKIVGEISL